MNDREPYLFIGGTNHRQTYNISKHAKFAQIPKRQQPDNLAQIETETYKRFPMAEVINGHLKLWSVFAIQGMPKEQVMQYIKQ